MTYARSVMVIHNMAHQGRGPMAELAPLEIPPHYEHLVRPLQNEFPLCAVTMCVVAAVTKLCSDSHEALVHCMLLFDAASARPR